MKSKIFSIIISAFLILPISVWAVEDVLTPADENRPVQEELLQQSDDESAEAVQQDTAEQPVSPFKQPYSKKKLIKKFLIAMLAVGGSSLVLYIGLSVYNSIRDRIVNRVKTLEGETPLQTPADIESAVKTFLDKTK